MILNILRGNILSIMQKHNENKTLKFALLFEVCGGPYHPYLSVPNSFWLNKQWSFIDSVSKSLFSSCDFSLLEINSFFHCILIQLCQNRDTFAFESCLVFLLCHYFCTTYFLLMAIKGVWYCLFSISCIVVCWLFWLLKS